MIEQAYCDKVFLSMKKKSFFFQKSDGSLALGFINAANCLK